MLAAPHTKRSICGSTSYSSIDGYPELELFYTQACHLQSIHALLEDSSCELCRGRGGLGLHRTGLWTARQPRKDPLQEAFKPELLRHG